MRWRRSIQLIDVHCEGEIGRVLTSGVLDIPGRSIADKLVHRNEVDDSLRRTLVFEPRGGPTTAVVLLLPATWPEADAASLSCSPIRPTPHQARTSCARPLP